MMQDFLCSWGCLCLAPAHLHFFSSGALLSLADVSIFHHLLFCFASELKKRYNTHGAFKIIEKVSFNNASEA